MAYAKLRGRIVEKYGTLAAYAKELGISRASLSSKMVGRVEFSRDEIIRSMNLLEIENVTPYFFED